MKRLYFCPFVLYRFYAIMPQRLSRSGRKHRSALRLCFASTRNGNHGNAEIYVMNTDGSQPVRLTHYPRRRHRSHLVTKRQADCLLSRIEIIKGFPTSISWIPMEKNIRRAFDDLEVRTDPAWSARRKNKSPTLRIHPVPDWAVYTKPLGGGEAERIAESGRGWSGYPAWSPDGTEIAFVSGKSPEWFISDY